MVNSPSVSRPAKPRPPSCSPRDSAPSEVLQGSLGEPGGHTASHGGCSGVVRCESANFGHGGPTYRWREHLGCLGTLLCY
jgi:hypothetical protein